MFKNTIDLKGTAVKRKFEHVQVPWNQSRNALQVAGSCLFSWQGKARCLFTLNGIQVVKVVSAVVMQVASVPRTLVVAAHPDDETIGAGVLISRTKFIHVAHATEGSPINPSDALAAGFHSREEYAAARRSEAARALALAGLAKNAITNLGFTDQRLACYLEELSISVLSLIEWFRPDIVLTHAYEGGHPDHDSLALACHVSKALHRRNQPGWTFELLEFTGYHAGCSGLQAYEFLPSRDVPQRYFLSAEERELKTRMLREFKTQAKTLSAFMSPCCENFRRAPRYDFCRPPHEGKLFYENFNWGVDGATWRNLASRALSRVGALKFGSCN